ncbi:MAG: sporulation protein YunB [Defluviitaleaceae bacterium]|nr:sporulation protein YunB [Defluviitaleaceae bacterium]
MGRKLRTFNRWLRRRRKPPGPPIAIKRRKKSAGRSGFQVPRRYIFFAMLILLVVAFVYSFYRFDRLILPLVLDAAELQLQTKINNVINDVVQEIIRENGITAEDFILLSHSLSDELPVLSVNTVLANEICNAAAMRISERLSNLEPETVYVPIGMALGLDTLAQRGPQFSFDLAPIGNALVNYETSFTAVGINQARFAVWLTVESVVRIINPVQPSEIIVTRNVSLVDTIIQGVVPEMYLSVDNLRSN